MNKNKKYDRKSVCVLVSGGADSCILLHQMRAGFERVVPLYIRNGLLWEDAELYWLKRFLSATASPAVDPLKILDLPMDDVYDLHWSLTGEAVPAYDSNWSEVYLPGRNLILLSKTVVFCALNGIAAVALGPLKTNQFSDSSRQFFSRLGEVAEEGLGVRLDILTPIAHLEKTEVLKLGRELPLELTFSCINPQGSLHCGACNKCAERIEAFSEAGIPDRTAYAVGTGSG
jgi:7-cyano-7-deazaguanine synthase